MCRSVYADENKTMFALYTAYVIVLCTFMVVISVCSFKVNITMTRLLNDYFDDESFQAEIKQVRHVSIANTVCYIIFALTTAFSIIFNESMLEAHMVTLTLFGLAYLANLWPLAMMVF